MKLTTNQLRTKNRLLQYLLSQSFPNWWECAYLEEVLILLILLVILEIRLYRRKRQYRSPNSSLSSIKTRKLLVNNDLKPVWQRKGKPPLLRLMPRQQRQPRVLIWVCGRGGLLMKKRRTLLHKLLCLLWRSLWWCTCMFFCGIFSFRFGLRKYGAGKWADMLLDPQIGTVVNANCYHHVNRAVHLNLLHCVFISIRS